MPKKVVRVESPTPSQPGQAGGPAWKPTSESKGQATTFRIIAFVLWLLAIAGEVFAIFWVLKQSTINMTLLIIAIVVIGALAVIGSLLWKKANQLDPASRAETVRFFIQNQLGYIMAILAFLPLIVLILMNKDMDQKQKGIAGGIAIVALVIAAMFGISFNPPSVEQYAQTPGPQVNQTALPQFPEESAVIIKYTGKDLVFWTKAGTVYHLCEKVSDLQYESKDNTIYSGTVAQAHANGKDRLTLKVAEELKQCGINATPVPAAPSPTPTRK